MEISETTKYFIHEFFSEIIVGDIAPILSVGEELICVFD